jgi:hypothetical protein
VFHDNLKHIGIQYHYIHDMVQRGVVKLQYVGTDEQVADVLTKPFSRMKFDIFIWLLLSIFSYMFEGL